MPHVEAANRSARGSPAHEMPVPQGQAPPSPPCAATAMSGGCRTVAGILSLLIAAITIFYTVQGFILARWSGSMAYYAWCENEVRVFNKTVAGCAEALKQPLPPPPYRRWVKEDIATIAKEHATLVGPVLPVVLCVSLSVGVARLLPSVRISPNVYFLGFVFNHILGIVTLVVPLCVYISANATVCRHLSVLACASVHILTSNVSTRSPWWADASYRAVFTMEALAECVVICGTRGIRALNVRWTVSVIDMALALVWLVSRPHSYTVFPFAAYSANWIVIYAHFQLSRQPPPEAAPLRSDELGDPLAAYVAAFHKRYVGAGRLLARAVESFLWLHLLLTAARGPERSCIPIIVFTAFLGSRWAKYHASGVFEPADPA